MYRREKQKQDNDLFAFSPSNQEVLQYCDCVKSHVNEKVTCELLFYVATEYVFVAKCKGS